MSFETGYARTMKVAGLGVGARLAGGALLGAGAGVAGHKAMTDRGYRRSMASSFTSDPVEYVTGYKKDGLGKRAIMRGLTGKSWDERNKGVLDYTGAAVGGGIVGGLAGGLTKWLPGVMKAGHYQ